MSKTVQPVFGFLLLIPLSFLFYFTTTPNPAVFLPNVPANVLCSSAAIICIRFPVLPQGYPLLFCAMHNVAKPMLSTVCAPSCAVCALLCGDLSPVRQLSVPLRVVECSLSVDTQHPITRWEQEAESGSDGARGHLS